jgi:hypothetical protein
VEIRSLVVQSSHFMEEIGQLVSGVRVLANFSYVGSLDMASWAPVLSLHITNDH